MVTRARELGLDVSVRTVKFYTTRGLLPKPVKNPFPGADGRARYYPADALRKLRKILQMKNQGFKLEQIRKMLQQRAGESLRQLSGTSEEDWRREVVFRYLNRFGSEDNRNARVEYLARVSGTERDEHLQRAARIYLVRELSSVVGQAAARQYVEEYFLSLSPEELARRMEPFRHWREEVREQEAREASPHQALRRLTGNLLLKLLSRNEFRRQVEAVEQRFVTTFQEQRPRPSPGARLLNQQADRARDLILEGLRGLREAAENREAQLLAQALRQFETGYFLLGQVQEIANRYAVLLGSSE